MAIKMKRNKPIPKAAALVIGLLLMAVGAGFTYFSYTFTQAALVTTGAVTHVEVRRSSISSTTQTTYVPTIAFLDEQGTPQSAQVRPGQTSYNFSIGTEKRIRYNPDDPSSIKLDSWFELWGIGFLFLLMGFGIFAPVASSMRQKKKPGYLPRGADASAEDVDRMTALLRKMGRGAEADEIIKRKIR